MVQGFSVWGWGWVVCNVVGGRVWWTPHSCVEELAHEWASAPAHSPPPDILAVGTLSLFSPYLRDVRGVSRRGSEFTLLDDQSCRELVLTGYGSLSCCDRNREVAGTGVGCWFGRTASTAASERNQANETKTEEDAT